MSYNFIIVTLLIADSYVSVELANVEPKNKEESISKRLDAPPEDKFNKNDFGLPVQKIKESRYDKKGTVIGISNPRGHVRDTSYDEKSYSVTLGIKSDERNDKRFKEIYDRIQGSNYAEFEGIPRIPYTLDAKTLETAEDTEYVEGDLSEADTYSIFMKDYYPTAYIVKSMRTMLHFAGYIIDGMDFGDVKNEDSPITYEPKMDRFRYPNYGEVLAGMYTSYTITTSIVSLKACAIYYRNFDPNVAQECERYLNHLKSFQRVHTIGRIFEKNPLLNDNIDKIPPKYTAIDILPRLIETIASLDDVLNQDFTQIVQDLNKIPKKEVIEETEDNDSSEIPDYKPHQSLDRAYTNLWQMLLKPIKENLIIFHNYFNDAMNKNQPQITEAKSLLRGLISETNYFRYFLVDHFIESIEEFIILPKSRPVLTTAWKELARSNYTLENTDFANMIFHILRTIEIHRIVSILPHDDGGTIEQPETLYTLVDTSLSRDGDPRDSNFLVVV